MYVQMHTHTDVETHMYNDTHMDTCTHSLTPELPHNQPIYRDPLTECSGRLTCTIDSILLTPQPSMYKTIHIYVANLQTVTMANLHDSII